MTAKPIKFPKLTKEFKITLGEDVAQRLGIEPGQNIAVLENDVGDIILQNPYKAFGAPSPSTAAAPSKTMRSKKAKKPDMILGSRKLPPFTDEEFWTKEKVMQLRSEMFERDGKVSWRGVTDEIGRLTKESVSHTTVFKRAGKKK